MTEPDRNDGSYPDDLLMAAVASVQATLNASSRKKLWPRYFEDRVGETNFLKILNNPNSILEKDRKVQDAFVRFYFDHSVTSPPEHKLYAALLTVLGLKSAQDGLDAYIGSYTSYRLTRTEGTLLKGNVKITFDTALQGYFFTHSSTQELSRNRIERFDHRGPVFLLSDRVYLLGAGNDKRQGSYLRPMILHPVDDPAHQELTGILLTEIADVHVPFASKTVLVQADCETKVLREIYSSDKAYEDFIRDKLRNESNHNGLLYGWSRG